MISKGFLRDGKLTMEGVGEGEGVYEGFPA